MSKDCDGSWIQTFTGKRVDVFNLEEFKKQIDIVDIAKSLSGRCRFSGFVEPLYTVGEHVVRVKRKLEAEGFPPLVLLAALLHDASEAYLSDVPRPIKYKLAEYRALEKQIQEAIFEYFGIVMTEEMHSHVKRADNILLLTEARDLLPGDTSDWMTALGVAPLSERIVPWKPYETEAIFYREFLVLLRQLEPVAHTVTGSSEKTPVLPGLEEVLGCSKL